MTDAQEQESARWEALSWLERYREAVAERDRLRESATAFLDQWEAVKPEIDNAFVHMWLRLGDYTGPTIEAEVDALRTALKEVKHHD